MGLKKKDCQVKQVKAVTKQDDGRVFATKKFRIL